MQSGPSAPTVLVSKLLKTRVRGKRFIALLALVALCCGVMSSLTSAKSPGRLLLASMIDAVRAPSLPPVRSNEGAKRLLLPATRSMDHSVPLLFPAQESEPTVTTDKLDYQPGEFVLITGSGFWPNEVVTLEVDHADGTEEGGAGHEPWTVTADAFGQFFTSWFVDPDDSLGSRFRLSALGASSNLSAVTFFTDAGNPAGDLDQCGNGPSNAAVPCTGTAWQNGNLNQNQAHYSEGDSVPYRLRFSNLSTTGSHTVTIEWDTTKSGKHALDYLTSFDRTETTANPCSGVAGCVLAGPKDTEPIPVDPNVTAGQNQIDDPPAGSAGGDDIAQIAGNFTLFNGNITGVSVYTRSGTYAGDSSTRITITFTATTTNPVLAWGGHIATRVDWGLANSAIAIPGSPYHMRFIDLDGSGGNQDRSLSASAVFFPVSLTIIKETNPDTAAVKTFDYTVTGNNLTPFSLTPPDGLTPDQKVFSLTDATTRTVTESDPAAASPKFELTSLTCQQTDGGLGTGTVTPNLGTRTVTLTPNEGESITCTYVNTQRGKIIVEKQTTPDGAAGNFTFTGDAAGTISDNGQIVVADLSPGTYTSTENDPTGAGFDLTSITCDDANSSGNVGTRTATFNVEAGETVKCIFTNEKDANIVIVKQTDPDGDTTAFNFNRSYGGDVLLSDGESNDSGDLDPGTYSVSEDVPAGWDLTSAICSDGSDPSSISLAAGETVTCTFTNQKDANIVIVKQTDPDGDTTDFNFNRSYGGDVLLSDGESNDSGDLNPGTYSVSEDVPAGWDLTSATCSDLSNPAAISLQAGETVTCTFTNRKRGMVTLHKLTNGVDNNTMTWNFSLDGQGVSETDSSPPTTVDFGGAKLVPGQTYTLCETGIPAGWTLEWKVDTNNDGTPDTTIPFSAGVNTPPVPWTNYSNVYDPNYVAPPGTYTNDTRCVQFTVRPGQTLAFEINNSFPGGEPRTIGFWKNWNTCTGGRQVITAAQNGGPAAGWFILDDLLNNPGYHLGPAFPGGLHLDGNPTNQVLTGFIEGDCYSAVNILDKSDVVNNKKKASDPAYNLAAQYLAALLNLSAGAETCPAVVTAVNSASSLLISLNFNGTGDYPKKGPSVTQANQLANTLDRYNNGLLCP